MINAVIIDDERLAREGIQNLLLPHAEKVTVLGEADNGKNAIQLIEEKKPDLLFLDIQMPDMTGLEMLDRLSYNPKIIFTTAYDKYAIEAFASLSIDYLLKPIAQQRFDLAIEKYIQLTGLSTEYPLRQLTQLLKNTPQKKTISSLPIKREDKILLIDLEDVSFFKAEDKYVSVGMDDGKFYLCDKSLNELMEKLPDEFVRVHRSYIVNLSKVIEVEKYFKGTVILNLCDAKKSSIKTSEKYSKEVKEKLGL